jgi:hypothetical protein
MATFHNGITIARRWNTIAAIISVFGVILAGYRFFNQEIKNCIVATLVVLSQWISIGLNARTLRSLSNSYPPP